MITRNDRKCDLTYPKETVMLDKELLDILVCPKCKGELEYDTDKNTLSCYACMLRYRVEDDIPIMLIDEAEKIEESEKPTSS